MDSQFLLFNEVDKLTKVLEYEYFILISPNDKIKLEVKLLKESLRAKIGLSNENLYSVAHISLFKLREKFNIDERIIQFVNRRLQSVKGFQVKLDGLEVYHHGPEKRSLVLKVEDDKLIREIFNLFHNGKDNYKRNFLPHLTLAKSISINDFIKISMDLPDFEYKGEFMCNRVTILKRTIEGNIKTKYSILHEADLQ